MDSMSVESFKLDLNIKKPQYQIMQYLMVVNTQQLDSLLVATWEEVLIKSFPYMTSSHLVASLRNKKS